MGGFRHFKGHLVGHLAFGYVCCLACGNTLYCEHFFERRMTLKLKVIPRCNATKIVVQVYQC